MKPLGIGQTRTRTHITSRNQGIDAKLAHIQSNNGLAEMVYSLNEGKSGWRIRDKGSIMQEQNNHRDPYRIEKQPKRIIRNFVFQGFSGMGIMKNQNYSIASEIHRQFIDIFNTYQNSNERRNTCLEQTKYFV
jgi:hypothetical protein